MMRWTLRLRLVLAFCALASLILFVGLASYLIHATTREDFRQMRTGSEYDLTAHNMQTSGLEIEGYWNPAGQFVARDIQPQPPLAPRLRGAIQSIDHQAQSLRVYGIDVSFTPATLNGDDVTRPVPFSSLAIGDRVEVKCKVQAGQWLAKKLYTVNVKESDKVKGMVTRMELDGSPPESIFIHDLEVSVGVRAASGPTSTLVRVEQCGRLLVQLQACRSAALTLASVNPGGESSSDPTLAGAMTELSDAAAEYGRMLGHSRDGGSRTGTSAGPNFRQHLQELSRTHDLLIAHVEHLLRIAGDAQDQHLVGPYVRTVFNPFLEAEITPLLTAYLWEAEEELGDQLRTILKRAEWTPQLALGVSVLGICAAILLGWALWRSINQPLQRLQDAAVKIGQGHLDTRVTIETDDELGVLGQAFNRMASDLSSTTVSMGSMESVLDSMASALIVLDAESRIVRVNRATCEVTGYSRDELLGQSLDLLCPAAAAGGTHVFEHLFGAPAGATPPAAGIELQFTHKDGGAIPVALSGAQLSLDDDSDQGFVCVAQDLTEQKNIQQGIRESLAEKELLLREVHHRVKNNMQVISSLLAIQARESDPEIAARLEVSQNRVRTIALIHEHLYLSAELAHIDLQGYIGVLSQHLVHTFGRSHDVQLEFDIEDLDMDIDQALSVGLIANELVTNSLKYAFPDGRSGTIRIETRQEANGTSTLVVSDDGCGYTAHDSGQPASLGSTLIAAFAKKLKGEVQVTSDAGTTTRITFVPSQTCPGEGGLA